MDSDGFRKGPDDKPLTVTFTIRSGAISRETQTLLKRDMDAIKLRMEFHVTPFQDIIKELEAGKFQLYFGGYGGLPNGYAKLLQLYSRAPVAQNASRFSLPEYDRQMERFLRTGNDGDQLDASRAMARIALAYVPIQPLVFRLENDFTQPWVLGYSPPLFDTYWKCLDIDPARKAQRPAHAR